MQCKQRGDLKKFNQMKPSQKGQNVKKKSKAPTPFTPGQVDKTRSKVETSLNSHGEIVFDARRDAGDELEENNQVLINPDRNLLVCLIIPFML